MKRLSGLALLALLACLVLATAAFAYRSPTGDERAAIQAATDRSSDVPEQSRPISDVRVDSTGTWAMATIYPEFGIYRATADASWEVEAVGHGFCIGSYTSDLGMPRSVGRNLGLLPCPKSREHRHERVVLGDRSFAINGLGWGQVRPHRISNGGDLSGYISHIEWRSWGGRVAFGRGRNSIFDPHGGYFPHPVRILLRASHRSQCYAGGPRAYRRLSVRVPRRPGGPLGPWRSWSGASTICSDPYARSSSGKPWGTGSYWRHCGSQNHDGAGWYLVKAHNAHCGTARKVARRYWHGNQFPFSFSCQLRSVGIELAKVYCHRSQHSRIQRVRFEVGA